MPTAEFSLIMKATPLSAVTMTSRNRMLTRVHEDAKFFCWMYGAQLKRSVTGQTVIQKWCDGDDGKHEGDAKWLRDPFILLLDKGGFVYFDFKFEIVDIQAFCFADHRSCRKYGIRNNHSKVFYGKPCRLPQSVIRPLKDVHRWAPLTAKPILDARFTHFAYMLPSEFLGESVFPKSGAFAYLHENPAKSLLYPIVTPGDNDGQEVEAEEPIVYDQPLYVPGLSESAHDNQNGGEGGRYSAGLAVDDTGKFMAETQGLILAKASDAAAGVEACLGLKDSSISDYAKNLKADKLAEELRKQLESGITEGEVEHTTDQARKNELEELMKYVSHLLNLKTLAEEGEDTNRDTDEDKAADENRLEKCQPMAIEILKAILVYDPSPGFQDKKNNILLACRDPSRPPKRAEIVQEQSKHIRNLHYVLCQKATLVKETGNDGGPEVTRDTDRNGEKLVSFWRKDQSRTCKLTVVEVASLRFYTTTSFHLVNDPLRSGGSDTHPLALTTYSITCGLKKLRALNFQAKMAGGKGMATYLWRGLKDRRVSDDFMIDGGSEKACMSTSESVEVVTRYSRSRVPLLFRIKIESPMDHGATLKWLSVYPDEDEILYPPLTCLEPLYKQPIINSPGWCVTVRVNFPS